jgi:hypothetical protein
MKTILKATGVKYEIRRKHAVEKGKIHSCGIKKPPFQCHELIIKCNHTNP